MRVIAPRSAYDINKSCPYEGPYRRPRERVADWIFTIVIFAGLGVMLFFSL